MIAPQKTNHRMFPKILMFFSFLVFDLLVPL